MDTTPLSRDQLANLLKSSAQAQDKGWNIYRYLKDNIGKELPSVDARSLLQEYMLLPCYGPSLLHSVMLGVAIKMSDLYPDFKFLSFVEIWGLGHLRQEDFEQQYDSNGRTFHSLAQRLSICILRRLTTHPDEQVSDKIKDFALQQCQQLGFLEPRVMAAVKIFESEYRGRKVRMVRLVDAAGNELSIEGRALRAKPWEILGRLFTVLPRRAEKSGNIRIDAIGRSTQSPAQIFGSAVGFVDSYDDKHKHYHIFDRDSRHFVAEAPAVRIYVGDYVQFAPIIPADDPFKSAIVISSLTPSTGRAAFGAINAMVEYVNAEKGYFAYTINGNDRGFGLIKSSKRELSAGMPVSLIMYQRRGKDGQKRPHVAETF